MYIFDVSDLPKDPRTNDDRPEELYQDGWDPETGSAEFGMSQVGLVLTIQNLCGSHDIPHLLQRIHNGCGNDVSRKIIC